MKIIKNMLVLMVLTSVFGIVVTWLAVSGVLPNF